MTPADRHLCARIRSSFESAGNTERVDKQYKRVAVKCKRAKEKPLLSHRALGVV